MNNITISKEEIFKLLLCAVSNMYKKVESYEYVQSDLKLCTYKYKPYKYDQSKLNLYTYKIVSYKYDKSGLNFN
jgi:hypothetical protein